MEKRSKKKSKKKGTNMTAFAQRTEEKGFPWWLVLLEGIAAAIIGLFLLTAPGATLFVLIQVLGIFWLVGGLFRIVSIFLDTSLWGWKLIAGALCIVAGIVVLQHPLWSSVLVPAIYVIILGIQGLVLGGVNLVMAFRGEGWGIGILGALSIVFGLVLLFNVWIGVAVLPFVLGAVGIVGGGAAIAIAFAMRSMERGGASVRDPAGTEGGGGETGVREIPRASAPAPPPTAPPPTGIRPRRRKEGLSQEPKPGGKAGASEARDRKRDRKAMVEQQPGRERTPEQPRERLTGSSIHDDGRTNAAVYSPTMGRPGLVTYAAIMLFALGGFHLLVAISEFADSTWMLSRLDIELFIPILLIWGVFDLLIGAIALYAGFSIISGGTFGWIIGYTLATVGIIRWLFYIPVAPVPAVVVIVLGVVVIYGLVKHADYFQTS